MGLRTCLLFLLLSVTANAFDYCSITCRGKKHTACLFPKAGPGKACKGYEPKPITDSERADIVRRHNEIRNDIALGKESGFPTASDMTEMYWDDELAMIAQRWADQCIFKHDKCRNIERGYVGQNLAIVWRSGMGEVLPQIQSWYSEIREYHYSDGPFEFSPETGHFTQLVWSRTNRVGCGRSYYTSRNFKTTLLVCNYAPGGNMLGQPLYKEGSPCDGCKCSPRYEGLCE